jgi:exodeoxyribonuclease V
MIWGPQQAHALTEVGRWHRQCMLEIRAGEKLSRPIFRLFGYAGTGKTTLVKHLTEQLGCVTAYAAYTGKAALVMRANGCAGASTIHSAMYSVQVDEETGAASFSWDENGKFSKAGLLAVDECSMVDGAIGADMLRYGVPILALGDPAQLEPVVSEKDEGTSRAAGFFTAHKPNIMLTEIYRQARDNPIIALATDVREGNPLRYGTYGTSRIIHPREINAAMVMAADQVLVGKNFTRNAYNTRIRELQGRKTHIPEAGERLICLKNDGTKGILNGGLFRVDAIAKPKVGRAANGELNMIVQSLDQPERSPVRVEVLAACFNGKLDTLPWQARKGLQEFAFGYALTVHKAQGSQWNNVMLFDERRSLGGDPRRWFYTGITRAAERIDIVM